MNIAIIIAIIILLIFIFYCPKNKNILSDENNIWADNIIDDDVEQLWESMSNNIKKQVHGKKIPTTIIAARVDRVEGFLQNINQHTHVTLERVPIMQIIQDNNIETNKKKANKINPNATSAEQSMVYFETAKTFTNDSQNVHDRGVTQDIAEIYKRIVKQSINSPAKTIMDVATKIRTNDKKKRSKISDALVRMDDNINIINLKTGERDILLNVYNRAFLPINKKNKENILDAFEDSLVDCTKSHGAGLECPTGRITRVIGALTLLDADPIISGGVSTREMYKNEAFNITSKSISDVISDWSSTNGVRKKYADAYMTGKPGNDETQDMFTKAVMVRVDPYLDEHKTKLPSNIREQVLAGVM